MFVPPENLNHWRYICSVLHSAIRKAQTELAEGQQDQALLLLDQTAAAVIRMGLSLEQSGAMQPGEEGADGIQAMTEDIPLHLLDTPANRRYLSTLIEALNAASDVDQERGYDSLRDNTFRGGGCAQMIQAIMRETLGEIIGPVSRVPE